jgi:2-phospho-L-lactate guanylyltransferase
MPELRVLVPVKGLDDAKSRLAALLDAAARARLALATLATVIAAARDAGCAVTLLTADPRVRSAAGPGVDVLDEAPGLRGLNPQLEAASGALGAREPLPQLLILHADLPLATPGAVRALIAAAPPAPSVTLVRSPDGGTNAMLLRPPGCFPLAYGRDSFARHDAAARAADMAVVVHVSPALSLDLDTPADLDALLAVEEGRSSLAGQVLAAAGLAGRPLP